MFLTEKKLRSLVRKSLLIESENLTFKQKIERQEKGFAEAVSNSFGSKGTIKLKFRNGKEIDNVYNVIRNGQKKNDHGHDSYTDIIVQVGKSADSLTDIRLSLKGPKAPSIGGGGLTGLVSSFLDGDLDVDIAGEFLSAVKQRILADGKEGPNRDFLTAPWGSGIEVKHPGFHCKLDEILTDDTIKTIMKGTPAMGGPIDYYVDGDMDVNVKYSGGPHDQREGPSSAFLPPVTVEFLNLDLFTIDEMYTKYTTSGNITGTGANILSTKNMYLILTPSHKGQKISMDLGTQNEKRHYVKGSHTVPMIYDSTENTEALTKERYMKEYRAFKAKYPDKKHPLGWVNLEEKYTYITNPQLPEGHSQRQTIQLHRYHLSPTGHVYDKKSPNWNPSGENQVYNERHGDYESWGYESYGGQQPVHDTKVYDYIPNQNYSRAVSGKRGQKLTMGVNKPHSQSISVGFKLGN